MSNIKLMQQPVRTEIQGDKLIPVNISKALYFKIKYLCYNIFDDEWSGTLFFKARGKITDKNFKIECVDVMPQNHGDKSWTEFKFDDGKFARYMMQNRHLTRYSMGLIHSHNTMPAFHSGRDMAELRESSDKFPYYLSLVVNNKDEMVAKIGMVCTRTVNSSNVYSYKIVGGKEVGYKKNNTITEEVLVIYDCVVTIPDYNDILKSQIKDENFIAQAALITEEKIKQEKLKKAQELKKPTVHENFDKKQYRFPFELGEKEDSGITKPELLMSRIISNNTDTFDSIEKSLRKLNEELNSLWSGDESKLSEYEKETLASMRESFLEAHFAGMETNLEIFYKSVYPYDEFLTSFEPRVKEALELLYPFEGQYEEIVNAVEFELLNVL